MEKFGLDQMVAGVDPLEFMASILERNDKQQIEIERGKLAVSVIKQMNNRSRLLLDAAKFELKRMEFAQTVSNNIKGGEKEKKNTVA